MADKLEINDLGAVVEVVMCAPPGKPVTLDLDVLSEFEDVLNAYSSKTGEMTIPLRNFYGEEVGGKQIKPQVLVVRSSVPKYFCVGANLDALRKMNSQNMESWVVRGHRVFNLLESFPLPTVALVEGYATGGGLELAMACDFIYAGEAARFGQTEAKLGLITGWGGSLRLAQRVGRSTAKRLFFTGELIDSREAASIGLVDSVDRGEVLMERVEEFASFVEANSSSAIAAYKRIQLKLEETSRELDLSAEILESLDCIDSEDTKGRLKRFFQERSKRKAKNAV